MDLITQQFGDDIDVVRQAAGFQGTADQMEMFARALLANSRSYCPKAAAVLASQ